ncbi:hypothetical protein LTR56_013900 [Elasticomyces elasticus]|nr:hypothetical protein LTR56_013900 [Elasticomyces elasticus]KAK3656239.1 hypothetical protein LTR22_009812 [Elasticomyces elasticus]KAK4924520.1 hypothetical protein LTR49_008410 [Elasticomyces elasticus]KAK5761719.1 hypothetical protein LTS12_008152 [Elasticomyces elasticus]
MAGFMERLWGDVFASGPTPTLIVATNVTFAALQALLLALFIGTYSIHFVILSFLSAGLWWSINWFANELRQAQAKEEEAERLRKQSASRDRDWKSRGEVADSEADDEGEDTETEHGMRDSVASVKPTDAEPAASPPNQDNVEDAQAAAGADSGADVPVSEAVLGEVAGTTRQRRPGKQDRSGDVSSTDSEWEKVAPQADDSSNW